MTNTYFLMDRAAEIQHDLRRYAANDRLARSSRPSRRLFGGRSHSVGK